MEEDSIDPHHKVARDLYRLVLKNDCEFDQSERRALLQGAKVLVKRVQGGEHVAKLVDKKLRELNRAEKRAKDN